MKKANIFLFLLLGTFLNAQNFEVVVGKKLDQSKSAGMLDRMICKSGDDFWFSSKELHLSLFGGISFETNLAIYDKNFNHKSEIELSTKKKDVYVESVISLNNSPVVFTREENKKQDYVDFDFSKINKEGKVEKHLSIGRFKFESDEDIPKSMSAMSPDSSLWVSALFIDNDDKKDILKVFVKVVDKDLNEVWSKIVDLQNAQRMILIDKVDINNDGEVLILYAESIGKKPEYKIDGKPGYQVKVAFINQKTPESEIIKRNLDTEGCFSNFYFIKPMTNGDFSVHALISKYDEVYANAYARYIFTKGTGELKSKSIRYFTNKEIELFKKEEIYVTSGKQEGLKEHYKFADVSFSENGESYVTLENSYYVTRSSRGGTYITYQTYNFIILRVNESGSDFKADILPVSQEFVNFKEYNSAAVRLIDGKYFIFYNDHLKNSLKEFKTDIKTVSAVDDIAPVVAWFDEKGGLKKQYLFDFEKITGAMVISSITKLDQNQIMFTLFEQRVLKDPYVNIGLLTIK